MVTSLICTACVSPKYLKSTKDECQTMCSTMGEFKYEKHDNNATNLHQCVSDCAIISGDLSILDVAGEKTCVASCGTIILLLFDLKAMECIRRLPQRNALHVSLPGIA